MSKEKCQRLAGKLNEIELFGKNGFSEHSLRAGKALGQSFTLVSVQLGCTEH